MGRSTAAGVTVTFAQSSNSKGLRAPSTASELRCRDYMAANSSLEFFVSVEGSLKEPRMQVTLHNALLKKLPLLADVLWSTSTHDAVLLPCSMWAILSLLVVLKPGVHANDLFHDTDESLPAHTLLIADFMGYNAVKDSIISWLNDATKEVVRLFHQYEQDRSNRHDLTGILASYTQVLLTVPDIFFKDVAGNTVQGWL